MAVRGAMEAVNGWMVGGALAIALPFAWRYLKGPGVKFLVGWAIGQLRKALAGTGVEDADLKQFEKDITWAFIKLAQRKFPKDGMGPERKKWLVDFLTSKVPFLKGQEASLGELVEALVAEGAAELDKLSAPPPNPGP